MSQVPASGAFGVAQRAQSSVDETRIAPRPRNGAIGVEKYAAECIVAKGLQHSAKPCRIPARNLSSVLRASDRALPLPSNPTPRVALATRRSVLHRRPRLTWHRKVETCHNVGGGRGRPHVLPTGPRRRRRLVQTRRVLALDRLNRRSWKHLSWQKHGLCFLSYGQRNERPRFSRIWFRSHGPFG